MRAAIQLFGVLVLAGFDGMGAGFTGPQGTANLRNDLKKDAASYATPIGAFRLPGCSS